MSHSGAGHREEIVESEWFASHLLGSLRWALGADGGQAGPTSAGRDDLGEG